jgi:hypothetical protein
MEDPMARLGSGHYDPIEYVDLLEVAKNKMMVPTDNDTLELLPYSSTDTLDKMLPSSVHSEPCNVAKSENATAVKPESTEYLFISKHKKLDHSLQQCAVPHFTQSEILDSCMRLSHLHNLLYLDQDDEMFCCPFGPHGCDHMIVQQTKCASHKSCQHSQLMTRSLYVSHMEEAFDHGDYAHGLYLRFLTHCVANSIERDSSRYDGAIARVFREDAVIRSENSMFKDPMQKDAKPTRLSLNRF